jgi:hypothetical protein
MSHASHQSCIDACYACAIACERCAQACFKEPNVAALADCIILDLDCAAMCRLAAAYMSRDSKVAYIVCRACASVCQHCQDECAKYQMDHCKACAEACRQCAQECRQMASLTDQGFHQSAYDSVAGLRQ